VASAFGHLIAAVAIVKVTTRSPQSANLWVWALISSVVADADVIGFQYGIEYGSSLGHRGLSHSILFAAVWSLVLVLAFFRKQESRVWTWVTLFLATLSHGILDAMTDGGLGVGFFLPFSPQRYFFSFRPISVSPIGVRGFWQSGGPVLLNEFYWIGLPSMLVIAFVMARESRRRR